MVNCHPMKLPSDLLRPFAESGIDSAEEIMVGLLAIIASNLDRLATVAEKQYERGTYEYTGPE